MAGQRREGEQAGGGSCIKNEWIVFAAVLLISTAAIFLVRGRIQSPKMQELFTCLDLFGTIVFSFGGVLVVNASLVQRRFFVTSACWAGVLTAVGGGTFRDLFSGKIPFWVLAPEYMLLAIMGAGIAIAVGSSGRLGESVLRRLDFVSLGVFSAIGVGHAVQVAGDVAAPGFLPLAVGFGALTGAGGGLIRDLLYRRPPTAFVTSYGFCAAAGGLIHGMVLATAVTLGASEIMVGSLWVVTVVLVALMAEITRQFRIIRDPNTDTRWEAV